MTNIIDAFSVFETIYNLSANNGGELIAKLDFGDRSLHPFQNFSSPNYTKLEWWEAYNKVKHEYALNYTKAKIDNVLEGLAGAFLLNVVHYPSIRLLWQLGFLSTGLPVQGGFQEIFLSEAQFENYYENAVSDLVPLNIGVKVDTPLFIYGHR